MKYASLETKNTVMESELKALRQELSHLKEELLSAHLLHQEAVSAQAHVEKLLESVLMDHEKLIKKEAETAKRLEALDQYGRKFTLVLAGKAIPPQTPNENIRQLSLGLLKDHLGICLGRDSLIACHRLHEKKTILVRFKDLDERMSVYLKRTKPIRHGLLIFESLTKDRMAIVQILNNMRRDVQPPFKTFYTFRGDIFVKVREGDRPIEIPVGTTREDIIRMCKGEHVEVPDRPLTSAGDQGWRRGRNRWKTVKSKKNQHRRPSAPPLSRAALLQHQSVEDVPGLMGGQTGDVQVAHSPTVQLRGRVHSKPEEHSNGGTVGRNIQGGTDNFFDSSASSSVESCDATLMSTRTPAPPQEPDVNTVPKTVVD